MTAATDTKRDPLALFPGLEFKVGDRVCGTVGVDGTPAWFGIDFGFGVEQTYDLANLTPDAVRTHLAHFLSRNVTEAHTEWTTPEPEHSEHAAFRYRITWRPDQPLKIEAIALTWTSFPTLFETPDDICSEDTYRAARRLLGIEPVAFPDEDPIIVLLLTAVRIADELSGDSSVWEVAL